eukprot:NODE_4613_length_459_cov_80.978049_g3979_i0.p2 GENE.NODE_4613_length_459_cov_80.978049_g3979_i0~~NODE_4613_length_459_cov_80.978049_g3979_i0.p2  ORF type:complete len:64 (+),score=1.87 NODE_4613_length_459_cov_80.978049_g3979_i0:51-242(+)
MVSYIESVNQTTAMASYIELANQPHGIKYRVGLLVFSSLHHHVHLLLHLIHLSHHLLLVPQLP